jgi:hypothetical protein
MDCGMQIGIECRALYAARTAQRAIPIAGGGAEMG